MFTTGTPTLHIVRPGKRWNTLKRIFNETIAGTHQYLRQITLLVKHMMRFLNKVGIDGFLIAIISVIIVAYLFPDPGVRQEPISLEEIAGYGLSMVFFFYGLKLNLEKLKSELSNWRMHIVIQLSTFLLFPLIALAIKPFFVSEATILWLGIYYMCALPSTVSSSVVMVSIAGGNISAAIFNASLSTLAGIFITPLWILPLLEEQAGTVDSNAILLKLSLQVLVPVLLGLLAHKWGSSFAERYKKQLRYFDQSVILLIIYTAFCHAFYTHAFAGFSWSLLILLTAGMCLLFLVAYGLIKVICRKLSFNRADTITVLFCGSKKSLVHGTVMSKVLFPAFLPVSILLLPIMLYHALQLIFVSIIAQKAAASNKKENSAIHKTANT